MCFFVVNNIYNFIINTEIERNGKSVFCTYRFCDELFDIVIAKNTSDPQTGLNIEISYFEIYNEKIHDLLCPSTKDKTGKKANLKVREHAVLGPYVEGLSTYTVKVGVNYIL